MQFNNNSMKAEAEEEGDDTSSRGHTKWTKKIRRPNQYVSIVGANGCFFGRQSSVATRTVAINQC